MDASNQGDLKLSIHSLRAGSAISKILERQSLRKVMYDAYWKSPATAWKYIKLYQVLFPFKDFGVHQKRTTQCLTQHRYPWPSKVLGFRLSQGKRNFSTKLLCWKCHESLLWGMFWGVRGRLGSGALWVKIFVFSRSHPIFFLPVLQTESMPIVSLYILIFNSQASVIIQYAYIHTYIHTHIHTYVYIHHTYVSTYTHIYIHTYIYMHIYNHLFEGV